MTKIQFINPCISPITFINNDHTVLKKKENILPRILCYFNYKIVILVVHKFVLVQLQRGPKKFRNAIFSKIKLYTKKAIVYFFLFFSLREIT